MRARDEYWTAVGAVLDPEVPVLSVIDLGIVRDMREEGGAVIVDITPTNNTVDEAMRIMEQLRRGESWSGGFILRHRDGRPIYGHVTDVPVLHENVVIGVVGLSRQARRDSQP